MLNAEMTLKAVNKADKVDRKLKQQKQPISVAVSLVLGGLDAFCIRILLLSS